ncbi:MAG: GNAT family N-acetyltransferase [Planctomycetia bacterium]|nr:GNAT family N-acetyltransferase [Planctomycetia bacterium]
MIRAAQEHEIALVRTLFLEYAQSLGFSLCFQGFQLELDELPGRYGPPRGQLLLAFNGDDAMGVVALRTLDENTAEMKRLYVRPEYRGRKLGRHLAQAIIDEARQLGFQSIKLDTVPTMVEARKMYESMGFAEIAPYYDNQGKSICMELPLTSDLDQR